MKVEIKCPNLGDGIKGGTAAAVPVKVGDTLSVGDTLFELETDKAVVPVPTDKAGKIIELHVKSGTEVKVGTLLAVLESADAMAPAPAKPETPVKANGQSPTPQPFLVPNLGDGIKGGTVALLPVKVGQVVEMGETLFELETDKAVVPVPASFAGEILSLAISEGKSVKVGEAVLTYKGSAAPVKVENATSALALAPAPAVPSAPTIPPNSLASLPVPHFTTVAAGPATRKLARELGVDLGRIPGTARGGRVTIADVKDFVKKALKGGGGGGVPALPELPDFSAFGEIAREPLTRIRQVISERLSAAWARVPHVHQMGEVDVTELTSLQSELGDSFKKAGSALSVTLFTIKALAEGLKAFPKFNASLDEARKELVLKKYFHIGVAVDTPDGLLVPVLKNVDKMTVYDVGRELKAIAGKAREKRLMPGDMMGASMTLSNLGGIGGTHFTPIINPPEVAILGAGRTRTVAHWNGTAFVPRQMMPVCLAYDHRVIDGADGARFLMFVTKYLEEYGRRTVMAQLGLPNG